MCEFFRSMEIEMCVLVYRVSEKANANWNTLIQDVNWPFVFSVEALHLGTLMAAHGYFFPISDHVLTLKDDGTFYRFQVRNN